MGCDIHCFIEYKHKGSDSWARDAAWAAFAVTVREYTPNFQGGAK